MIIDVECEDGTTQIARTVLENQDSYIVNFLEKNIQNFYDFIDAHEEVLKGFVLLDDSEDEDYECTETDEEESEDDISLVDEEEA
jgi:hypothetical protein